MDNTKNAAVKTARVAFLSTLKRLSFQLPVLCCDGVYLSSDAKLPSTVVEALAPIISESESVPETSTPSIPESTSVAKASNSFEKNYSNFSPKPTRFSKITSTEVKSPTSISKTSTVNTEEKNEKTTGPIAFKILDGTKLVVKTNSTSGELEFNVAPAKVFRSGEVNWFIPNISQADIDAKVSNAKINKIK